MPGRRSWEGRSGRPDRGPDVPSIEPEPVAVLSVPPTAGPGHFPALRPVPDALAPEVDACPRNQFRQYTGENSTSIVKTSSRPSNMVTANNHFASSLTETKLLAT
jgi:hypothetical protein